jgi:hypothetical protein
VTCIVLQPRLRDMSTYRPITCEWMESAYPQGSLGAINQHVYPTVWDRSNRWLDVNTVRVNAWIDRREG